MNVYRGILGYFGGLLFGVVLSLCFAVPSHAQKATQDKWEGWATTTQFGSGDGPWGDPPISIKMINNQEKNRMGAAIPWRFYFLWYKSKKGEVDAVYGSIAGNNSEKACFQIQPIRKYPNQLTGSTDASVLGIESGGVNNVCKSGCTDINADDKNIAALDSQGNPYPVYLVVPFEGCGGNCYKVADCFNDCVGATGNTAAEVVKILNGELCDGSTPSSCAGMKVLANCNKGSATWEWNKTVKTNFLKYSCPLGISKNTQYGQDVSKQTFRSGGTCDQHVNWCSGQNMHFDIALTNPYWEALNASAKKPPAYTVGEGPNIIVRYRRVQCDINGTFKVMPKVDGTCCNVSSDGTCEGCTEWGKGAWSHIKSECQNGKTNPWCPGYPKDGKK